MKSNTGFDRAAFRTRESAQATSHLTAAVGMEPAFFAERIDPEAVSRLEAFVQSDFERMTYTEAVAVLEYRASPALPEGELLVEPVFALLAVASFEGVGLGVQVSDRNQDVRREVVLRRRPHEPFVHVVGHFVEAQMALGEDAPVVGEAKRAVVDQPVAQSVLGVLCLGRVGRRQCLQEREDDDGKAEFRLAWSPRTICG